MYTVIREFIDLKDNNHKYVVGDKYPHHGGITDIGRIRELSGYGNLAHKPLIKESTERAFSLPREDALDGQTGVNSYSAVKRKGKPRRRQENYARADS